MGASIARKLTRLGLRVLRHHPAQVCASSCLMTCFSCAAIVFRYSKRARTFFTKYVPPEVTLLEIPPCQTPMCGVAYSCSYVLLFLWIEGHVYLHVHCERWYTGYSEVSEIWKPTLCVWRDRLSPTCPLAQLLGSRWLLLAKMKGKTLDFQTFEPTHGRVPFFLIRSEVLSSAFRPHTNWLTDKYTNDNSTSPHVYPVDGVVHRNVGFRLFVHRFRLASVFGQ